MTFNKKLSLLLSLIALILNQGCASGFSYQKASESWFAGSQGYFEKEISHNEYILAYAWIGGSEWSQNKWNLTEWSQDKWKENKQSDIQKLAALWSRRANELCKNGFSGEAKPIYPWESKIERLAKCDRKFCEQYPVIEEVIKCK